MVSCPLLLPLVTVGVLYVAENGRGITLICKQIFPIISCQDKEWLYRPDLTFFSKTNEEGLMTKKEGKVLKGFLTAAMAYSLVTTCPILLPVVALSAVWCDKRKRRR